MGFHGGVPVIAAVILGLAAAPVSAADGGHLYAEQCSGCHGADGRGDGPAAVAIVPKPRNFRSPEFWSAGAEARLGDVVRHGKPGTMMPPFAGLLNDEQIDAVIAFLRTFDPRAGGAAPAPAPPAASGAR
jgi:high-affinity iron transporter